MKAKPPDERKDQEDTEQQLYEMERQLIESYCDLGKMVLDMAETEGRKTNRLVDAIIEKRRKLAETKHEKQCANCGAANEADSQYCRQCGSRLPILEDERKEPNE